MRQIYQRLTSPPTKGKAPSAMKELGLKYDDFRDANHNLLPIQQVFEKLATRMDKMKMSRTDKGAIYAALFGVNASSAAQALGESYKDVEKLDKKVQQSQNMNKGQGYVAQLSQKNMNTFSKQWNRIKQGLLNSGVEIANAWMPTLTKMAKGAADLLESFQKLPAPAKKFVGLAAVVTAAIGPLAILAGTFLKVGNGIKSVVSALGKTKIVSGLGKGIKNVDRAVPGSKMLNSGYHNRQSLKKASGKVGRGIKKVTPRPVRRLGSNIKKTYRNVIHPKAKVKDFEATTRVGRFGKTGLLERASRAFPKTSKFVRGSGKLAKGAGRLAKGVPVLDIAMAGLNMVGTNKKNAGKKTGSTIGILGGGLVGSLFGPIGSMAGAAIGEALGAKLGKTIDKTMPKKVRKSLGKVINSIGKTFNNLLKPFKSTIKSIKKTWDSSTKGISKTWNKYVVKPLSGKKGGKFLVSVFKDLKKIMVPTMKIAGVAFKVFGATVKTTIKVVAHVLDGLIKTVSGVVSLISDIFHGRWKNIWKDAKQIFSGIFGTIGNVFSDIVGSIWDGIKDFGKNVGKLLTHPVKTVKSWFNGGNSKKDGSKNKGGKSHADGGPISYTHTALVNEAGTEMAYDPRKGRFRLLGNGPTLAKVHAGEHILNAKDTAKVLSGGLGKDRTLPGYAKGTTKLKTSKLKRSTNSLSISVDKNDVSSNEKNTSKSMKKISKFITSGYDKSVQKASKSVKSFGKTSKSTWGITVKDTDKSTNSIKSNTVNDFNNLKKNANKITDKISSNTVNDFDNMQKNSMKQMNQMHKGMNSVANAMVNDFYKIFNKLSTYAHKAMAATIKQLNGGISGINIVLNKFGGGGSVLPLIHYAQGSKGPIGKHTMAVVNDAKVGPRQEAIVKPSGHVLLPQGNDVVLPLGPGDEVLNGSETAKLQDIGALPHFAKGTGGLKRLIENNNKDPKAAWQNNFTDKVQGKVGTFLAGALAKTSKGASNKVGLPWNAEVWSQLNAAMSGGDAAGGPWRHSPGLAETDGFNSGRKGGIHDGVDFSGSVGSAIRAVHGGKVIRVGYPPSSGWGAVGHSIVVKSDDGKQVIYQEYGMAKNAKVSVGDIIKPGQTVATLGHNNVGTPPHVHIGVSDGSVWDHGGSSHNRWHDITKMHGKSDGTAGFSKDKNKSKNPELTKLVKKELGNRLKWVNDKLGEDAMGNIGNFSLSGGLGSRARSLAAALKKLYPSAKLGGIAGVLGNWVQESQLNPNAINAKDHGTGFAQWTFIRETRMRNWLKKHHYAWNSAAGQLDWALHEPGMNGMLKSVLRMTNPTTAAKKFFETWESGGALDWTGGKRLSDAKMVYNAISNHANGGWAENGKVNVFGEVPGQNEVAINTSRPSADKLIMEAMSDRASKNPDGIFGQIKEFSKIQNEFKKMKMSRNDFNKSVKANTVSQKPITIKPSITYHPEIHIEGSGNPGQTEKIVTKQLTEDRKKFKSMLDDYIDMTMSAQY